MRSRMRTTAVLIPESISRIRVRRAIRTLLLLTLRDIAIRATKAAHRATRVDERQYMSLEPADPTIRVPPSGGQRVQCPRAAIQLLHRLPHALPVGLMQQIGEVGSQNACRLETPARHDWNHC